MGMGKRTLWQAAALLAAAMVIGGMILAQQPPDRRDRPPRDPGAPGGPRGFVPGGGVVQALDDLKLSGKKKETGDAAVRAYEENLRKLTELARADLLLKMKEILSDGEF